MTARAPRAAWWLGLLLLACAPVRPPPPLPPRPAERSSVDVLLRHRGELGLSDDQVVRLESIDEARESQVAALRAQLAEHRKAARDASGGDRPADIGTGSGRTPGGPTGRFNGSTAGPGARGGRTASPLKKEDEGSRLRQRMDDADTRAYVDAVTEVLTEAQRPAAERLASAYREALFDYREAVRRQGKPVEE